MIVDSHQHFWQLARGDYHWLTPTMTNWYRDFMPDDLLPILQNNNVAGTILIQAAATQAETEFLLSLANDYDCILGVVGWLDMLAYNAVEHLANVAQHQRFCGIRPMLQDIDDVDWILNPSLKPVFAGLIDLNLSFDALVKTKHLANLLSIVKQFPALRIIIDHGAKPDIKNQAWLPWATLIQQLSQYEHVYCKCSGLLSEASEHCSIDEIKPYLDHLYQCFGRDRLVWGSDWPIVNDNSSYEKWLAMAQDYFSSAVIENVLGKNCLDFYQI